MRLEGCKRKKSSLPVIGGLLVIANRQAAAVPIYCQGVVDPGVTKLVQLVVYLMQRAACPRCLPRL